MTDIRLGYVATSLTLGTGASHTCRVDTVAELRQAAVRELSAPEPR